MKIRLASWNVNGFRARMKGGFETIMKDLACDIVCLQETKIMAHEVKHNLPQRLYINSASRKGYSGTGLLVRDEPLKISYAPAGIPNDEGRVIVAEFEKFLVVNVYTPNSKEDLSRLEERCAWDAWFCDICGKLDSIKPVIITGDLNVAHKPIDVHYPQNKEHTPGFTAEERRGMNNLISRGFTDSFRHIKGDVREQYTCWSNFGRSRERNMGWRLDYFLVSNKLKANICDASIERYLGNSDHCPVTLTLDI